MSYLTFEDKGTSESGKTGRWTVNNAADGAVLGWVEWKSPWRRYWFCPVNGTGFDAACLRDIEQFLTARMEER